MVPFNTLIFVAIAYVALLFVIAAIADRRARTRQSRWIRSPLTYTLSLSVYCTAWTFYGAVGNAARSGLEFLTIYLGPTLVFLGWWWILRKLVRIGRAERITSIADLISSRYGKSTSLAVLVTLLAVVGTTPYIALQLQSVTLSFAVFADAAAGGAGTPWQQAELNQTALYVAVGLALFTILFGTRNLDANERHHGVVTAIAIEAIVKLVALLCVGVFVVWGVSGGPNAMMMMIEVSPAATWQPEPGRWIGMTMLSAIAVICLPRMFQVLVVENADENHLAIASWAFPLYLLAMSLFVLPIAVVGLAIMPDGTNPDLFVLTIPLAQDQSGLAMLAFLGGFSSATSMVIVASIALSTMVSNHIVIPLWLNIRRDGAMVSGDVRDVVILSRRISIGVILGLGYLYFQISGGSGALSAIGLVSFVGVAQVFPALMGALFWRGASRFGALTGVATGFVVWGYTLFFPAIGLFPDAMMAAGPLGLEALRPQALMGTGSLDPLVHAIFWSLFLNSALFVLVSLLSFPKPLERLQGASFVNVFDRSVGSSGWAGGQLETEDLLVMAQRLLGGREAQELFQTAARMQGKGGYLPDPTPEFVDTLERKLTGSVGAAAAHAMMSRVNGQAAITVEDLLAVADESAQMLEYSSALEAKSTELQQTARQLRLANEKLTLLSVQKDAFLSQVSHELRTPMTSIRSFSDFLMKGEMSPEDQRRYSTIINDESIRLTRLLDDLLDLSVLESGSVQLNDQLEDLASLIDRAVSTVGLPETGHLEIIRKTAGAPVILNTDTDRLTQVFINLISNAQKYCDAAEPKLEISWRVNGPNVEIDFVDNGSGIPDTKQNLIFEKFSRLTNMSAAGSAGLGLAISREIIQRLGGSIGYLPGQGGAAFRLVLPRQRVSQAKSGPRVA
ncbi:MAG: ATP-binding protein [Pseudomonadota bacterium]